MAREDLQAHPSQLKFAFFHYPMYSSNGTEVSDPWLRGPDSLEGLLARNGVAIGFNGHAHNYTRNAKPTGGRSPTSRAAGGLSSSRRPVRRAGRVALGWSYSTGGSALRHLLRPTSIDQVFHFLKVSVSGFEGHRGADRLQGTHVRRAYVRLPERPTAATAPSAAARQDRARPPGHGRCGEPTAPSKLTVPIASGAGSALVAAIAVQAGTTTSVSSDVTDSAGNPLDAWPGGPALAARIRASRCGTARARPPWRA